MKNVIINLAKFGLVSPLLDLTLLYIGFPACFGKSHLVSCESQLLVTYSNRKDFCYVNIQCKGIPFISGIRPRFSC